MNLIRNRNTTIFNCKRNSNFTIASGVKAQWFGDNSLCNSYPRSLANMQLIESNLGRFSSSTGTFLSSF